MPALFKTNATVSKTSAADAAVEPAAAGISIRLQERIRELEQTLREERRALAETEQRYEKLEEKYNALLRRSDPTAQIDICSSGEATGASSRLPVRSTISLGDSSKLCSHN